MTIRLIAAGPHECDLSDAPTGHRKVIECEVCGKRWWGDALAPFGLWRRLRWWHWRLRRSIAEGGDQP